MSRVDDDEWEYLQEQAIADLIESGIREQRDSQIAGYLGTYGDAVQERIDRCLAQAAQLIPAGFPGAAVILRRRRLS